MVLPKILVLTPPPPPPQDAGVDGFTKQMGLTAPQFGDNLVKCVDCRSIFPYRNYHMLSSLTKSRPLTPNQHFKTHAPVSTSKHMLNFLNAYFNFSGRGPLLRTSKHMLR